MRRRHLKPDPYGGTRHPLVVFLLLLAVVSGVARLSGAVVSRSVDANLPELAAIAWAIMLVGGPGAALLGMYWQGDSRTGLGLKGIGYFTTGIASVLYSLVVLLSDPEGTLLNAGIILGFGVSCFIQFKRVDQKIREVISLTEMTSRGD